VNRHKLVKRSMYGRAGFALLRRRVLAARFAVAHTLYFLVLAWTYARPASDIDSGDFSRSAPRTSR